MSTYTHQNHAAPLARSNSSFLGTIKNIVTAPFTWFAGSEDEFEDAKGKRRRLPVAPEDVHMDDESLPSSAKRMRVGSPDRDMQPYLDPPRSAFPQPPRTSDHSTSGAVRDITRSPRKTLHIPSTSNQLPRNRRTVSPFPSGSHLKPEGVTRTMSLDPPSRSRFSSRIQPASSISDLQSEPNHTGDSTSTSRDLSMSPRRLRVRSSLTPQPSGTGFGPVVPPRRERGADEPPPLSTLMSNPMFVKPPPVVQKQGAAEPQKQLTLGTLIDSQRSARAPGRQSSILFGTGSMTDVSARHLWPVNKAEIALHELEVYKTPLLPTRLKGATAVPDMFLHKERKHITLMTDDRPVKPRLGTKSKEKGKGKKKERERGTVNGTKPYAGEGGMKKWLARRKKEEEEAKERERAEAMEDERAEEEERRSEAEAARKRREEELKAPPPLLSAPVFEPKASRVGRMRNGRNHLERPVSRRAKYSAAYEDEDEDMEESHSAEHKALEEAAKKVPAFELPSDFTFAKETSIAHDLTHAKEPPIVSLPFSLTKPAPARAVPVPPAPETVKATPIAVPPTPAPAPPTISLVPPTPESAKVVPPESPTLPATVGPASGAPPTSSGIPNFSNSSVFAKPATITPPSFFTPLAVEQSKPAEVQELNVPKAPGATGSLFGAPLRPISVFATPTLHSAAASSTFGAPPTIPKEAERPTTTAPSLAAPFAFGTPAKPVESVPAPASSLSPVEPPAAEPAKPAAPSNGPPFAFGAPPPAPSPAAAISTPAAPGIEGPKSAFTFGQPAPPATSTSAPAPVIAPPAADTSKSPFGTPPPATPFSFGQRPSTAPAEEKPAMSPFSFGTTSTVEKKPTTGFSFGSSTASTAAPATPATFTFGGAPSGTTAADVSSKPFSFGATTSTRPVTPPKAVQEVMMDESPARDMVLNGNGKPPERPTLSFAFNTPSGSALFAQSPATTTAPFSFGGPGATANPFAGEDKKDTKPAVSFSGFGQASSTGFAFGQKPPESPSTSAPAAPPFQFAQPSPTVAPVSPFSFGAPPASAAPFGQPSVASAPPSPSFNRPSGFTFGTPTTTQPAAGPFAFGAGSQPASPSAGNSALPSGTTGNAPFTFGATTNASLFTMGSAPPPAEGAGGRRIKGLPRRGGRR
ncbi:hypothetical protein OG21DRAFT_1482683 [Imleria badia]|nr:hypothetical protein OG21DRAFT_1482683 [Imleria badia]